MLFYLYTFLFYTQVRVMLKTIKVIIFYINTITLQINLKNDGIECDTGFPEDIKILPVVQILHL